MSKIHRREMIKTTALAIGACTVLPAYLTSARAADNPQQPPSRRINLGCVGIGGQGEGIIPFFCHDKIATPIAFADVDHDRGKNMIKRYPEAKTYHDFRKMYDEMGKDIDAVTIATPDHTHFTATILAMSMGKHVYTEKPLTHSFQEAEILMRAEKKYGVVTQMGNHGHTSAGSEQFKKLVSHGIVDDIVKIEAWKSSALWHMGKDRINQYPQQQPIPASLNSWDLWCGPSEVHPYNSKYHPFNWRGFFCYGGGIFGDWGPHIIDLVHNYLKLGLPTQVKAVQCFDCNPVIFPRSSNILFKFPERGPRLPAVELDWKAGMDFKTPQADPKYGEKQADGTIKIPDLEGAGTFLHRKQNDYIIKRGSHRSASRIYPLETMASFGDTLKAEAPIFTHQRCFIEACMGRGKTESPFEKSGVLTQVLLLGMIAEQLNEDLSFDPIKKMFVGNDSANALLKIEPRAEWASCYKLA